MFTAQDAKSGGAGIRKEMKQMEILKHHIKKEYLGDAVYIEIDQDLPGVLLTTNNGYIDDPRNKIYLDTDVLVALIAYLKREFCMKEIL